MSVKKAITAVLVAALALLLVPFGATAAPPDRGSITEAVTGVLDDGSTFEGTLDITEIVRDGTELLVSGTLEGTATDAAGVVTDVSQSFTDVPLALTSEATGNGNACDILNLDLGPIFLDLLGLQVDLSDVQLDIRAVPGAGNLLGNLLCAVAGLLDGPGLLGGLGQVIDNLLGRINNLLG